MQCPGQYILAGLSQPDMRHSHSSPSTRDRKKNLRKLSHVQTICMIVETAAINTAAQEKYLRNSGSAPSVLNRFFVAKKQQCARNQEQNSRCDVHYGRLLKLHR